MAREMALRMLSTALKVHGHAAKGSDGLRRAHDSSLATPAGWTPFTIDAADDANAFSAVSCVDSTGGPPSLCVGVDVIGYEVTWTSDGDGSYAYDKPVNIGTGVSLTAVSCPSQSQCTAVDTGGDETTFDPTNPASTASTVDVDPDGGGLWGVSCADTSSCMAVDAAGNFVEINSPADDEETIFDSTYSDPSAFTGISCTTIYECVAVDEAGDYWTPTSSSGDNIDSESLNAISCSTTSFCAAVDDAGYMVEFDPLDDSATKPFAMKGDSGIQGTTCVGTTQVCVPIPKTCVGSLCVGKTEIYPAMVAVSCLADTCDTVDQNGNTWVITDNGSPDGLVNQDQTVSELLYQPDESNYQGESAGVPATGISCVNGNANTADCDVVLTSGAVMHQVISPETPSSAEFPQGIGDGAIGGTVPIVIDQIEAGTEVAGLSCPSDDLCVGVDADGYVSTINPISGVDPTMVAMDASGGGFQAVSCPSTTQCTGVDDGGNQVTFNPEDLVEPTPVTIDPNGGGLTGVSCPSSTECAATDVAGDAIVFNPTTSSAGTIYPVDTSSGGLAGIACPSTTQCTAIDDNTGEVTFNPASPGTPTPVAIDPNGGETAVACPNLAVCTVVDDSGDIIGIHPDVSPVPITTATESNLSYESAACNASICIAGDANGNVSSFNQSAVTTVAVDQGANGFTAAGCTGDACFVGDDFGLGYGTGTSSTAITANSKSDLVVSADSTNDPDWVQSTGTRESFPTTSGPETLPCNPDKVYGAAVAEETDPCDAANGTLLTPSDHSQLPDGGTLDSYNLAGGEIVEIPSTPRALNLSAAPSSVQAAYGVPAAPAASSQGFAQWAHEVSDWQADTSSGLRVIGSADSSDAATASNSTTAADSSPGLPAAGDYGGWEYAPLGDDAVISQVLASYNEPQLLATPSACGNLPSVGFWTGLANDEANSGSIQEEASLAQDGTTAGPNVPAEAFFELANGSPSDMEWTQQGGDNVKVRPKHEVVVSVSYVGTGPEANAFTETISGRYRLVAYMPRPNNQNEQEVDFNEALTVAENPQLTLSNGKTEPATALLHFRDVRFYATEGIREGPYPNAPLSNSVTTLSPYVKVSSLSNGVFNVRWEKGC